MIRRVTVLLGNPKMPSNRKKVEAELLQERNNVLIVRLPDGNIITRKKSRDLVKEEENANIQ